MAELPFIQLFVGDYLADTRHLSTEQHGAYLLILMSMWRTEDCALANDPVKLARIAGVTPARWLTIAPEIMEFMTEADGQITQKRLLREWHEAHAKRGTKVRAGRAGGKAKSLKTKDACLAKGVAEAKQTSSKDVAILEPEPDPQLERPSPIGEGQANGVLVLVSGGLPVKRKGRGKSPKVPLPPGFVLDEKRRLYALSKGVRQDEVEQVFENFQNHHLKAGNEWSDWDAAWRQWASNHRSFSRSAPVTRSPDGRSQMAQRVLDNIGKPRQQEDRFWKED